MKIRWEKLKFISSIQKIVFIWVFLTFLVYALFSPGVKLSIESFFLDAGTFFGRGFFLSDKTPSQRITAIQIEGNNQDSKGVIDRFIHSLELIKKYSPKFTVVLLPPPYDERIVPLIDKIKKQSRTLVGVYNIFFTKDLRYIPESLRPILSRVYSADLNTARYSRVVRSVPLLDYGFDIEDKSSDDDLSSQGITILDEIEDNNDVVTNIGSLEEKNYSFFPGKRRYKTILAGVVNKIDRNKIDRIKSDLVSFRIQDTHSENILLHYKIGSRKDEIKNNTINYEDLKSIDYGISDSNIISKIKDSIIVIGMDNRSSDTTSKKQHNFLSFRVPAFNFLSFSKEVSGVYVSSLSISNVVNSDYLRIYKNPYLYIMLIVLALVFNFIVWKKLDFKEALLLYFVMIFLIIVLTSFVQQKYNEVILMSDFIVVSTLSFIFLGGWKFKENVTSNMFLREKAMEEKVLEGEYDEFLERVVKDVESLTELSLKELKIEDSSVEDKTINNNDSFVREKTRSTLEELQSYVKELDRLNTKIHKERISLDISLFNLKDLVEEVINSFCDEIKIKDVKFDLSWLSSVEIKTDREILKEILVNLVSNAVKYSFPSSSIKIYTEEYKRYLKLYISDYGIPITVDTRDHVFEKFYRAKDNNVRNIKGFGMGLYLSRYFASIIGVDLGGRRIIKKKRVEFYLKIKKYKYKKV